MLELTIDGLPATNSSDKVNRWAWAKAKKLWEGKVAGAVLLELGRWPKPLDRAVVTLTRCSTTEPDADNLASSFKAVLDGLVKARVIVDDKPASIACKFQWEKAPRGKGCVRIRVEPAVAVSAPL